MKSIIISLILCLFLSNSLYSGTIDPYISDDKYIECGDKFDSVLEILGSYKDNKQLFKASCVAIDKNWVLTAAHVVKDSRFSFIYNEKEKRCVIIDDIILNDDFTDKVFGKGDIALCHTSSDLALNSYPELYSDEDEIGKHCYMAGYGFTGTFMTGIKHNDGKKRGGSNKIDYISDDLLICSPSVINKTELEFLIASGDSGGGLFIDGKLAGINSCIFAVDKKPDSTYNDESGHTRISKFAGWIKQVIQKRREQAQGLLP